jgi:hypothetical protein
VVRKAVERLWERLTGEEPPTKKPKEAEQPANSKSR